MKQTNPLIKALRGAAVRAMEQTGGRPKKIPGHAQCWEWKRGVALEIVAVKATTGETVHNRWMGFSPPKGGKWGPLDHADSVMVAALDPQDPSRIEVYLFPAQEVRDRLDKKWKALTARGGGKQAVWLHLNKLPAHRRDREGSGLAEKYPPIKVFRLDDFLPPFAGAEATARSDEDQAQGGVESGGRTLARPGTTLPLAVATAKAKAYLAAALGISPDTIEIVIRN